MNEIRYEINWHSSGEVEEHSGSKLRRRSLP